MLTLHFCTSLSSLFSAPTPPSNLRISAVSDRSVSYTFTASPTSGATYRAAFTTQRLLIPQPPDDTADSAGLRTKSGLIPDVDYTIQVFAVQNGAESTAISADFTTLPNGKSILPWQLMLTWLAVMWTLVCLSVFTESCKLLLFRD